MHNSDSSRAEDWTALVRVLHDNADDLVAQFMQRVRHITPYGSGTVPSEVVEADAVASFDYLLRRIGNLPVPARLEGIGPSIGRDRARREVPLDDLLTAVRLDFRVLWNALREASGRDDAVLLVERAEDVWGVVEEYTTTIQASYLEEAALMSRERVRERAALVAALLSRLEPDPRDVSRVALALDVDVDATFVVAAVLPDADQQLRAVADQLSASGRRAHLHETSGHTTLIARWHGDVGAGGSSLFRTVRCGVAPVASGLAEVPRAARMAREIVDVLPPEASGPHEVKDAWMMLAGARLGDLGQEVARTALSGLDSAAPGERERLLDTAVNFAHSGSASATAGLLYCHRNTVVNRLKRLTELTGLDAAKPRDAALVLLAVAWQRGTP